MVTPWPMVDRDRSGFARSGKMTSGALLTRRSVPSVQALAGAVGNRALGRMARGPGRPRLQRMLIQLGHQWAENENAKRLRESNPIEYRGGTVSGLRAGEVLHLVAHSGGGTFGEFDAPGLFDWLRASGMPPRIGGIQLHGCESSSFAKALSKLVNTPSKGWDVAESISVVGVPGYHFVTSSGASWTVGAKQGNPDLWSRIRDDVMNDPSDENVARLAQSAQEHQLGNLLEINNLRSEASVVRKLRDDVRRQLEEEVRAVARHPGGSLSLERQDLDSLKRRIAAFVRLTDAAVPAADGAGEGLAMAQRAVARGLEVLNGLLDSRDSKHLKPHLRGVDLRDVRAARATLLTIQKTLPDSVDRAAEAESLVAASEQLSDLRGVISQTPGSSPEAKRWVRAWEQRFGTALELLRDAELQQLKDPLLAILRGIRFAVPEVPPRAAAAEPDWDALIASLAAADEQPRRRDDRELGKPPDIPPPEPPRESPAPASTTTEHPPPATPPPDPPRPSSTTIEQPVLDDLESTIAALQAMQDSLNQLLSQ